ncbi:FHA domain-containing protein [Ginsengibacter hankyongi]|uniref:FHA domain-containing protein n=1 Tax=Ginsengibacter hankyongi TaxID=2607284 RepID=A0A5J5IMJ5_9BACT|nr:FHA domain-containing protein [Ginsengibacter hankyongi]KAA9042159.1 FHA domain-containing protein [Ginsengibacter hankyongi]
MFNLFKERPHDVKGIRHILLQTIKEKLQRAQGGEGGNIMGVYLFINCSEAEKHLYEAAVFSSTPGKFKVEEVQKIADDYAITLSTSFKFEVAFTNLFPPQAELIGEIDAAIFISTKRSGLSNKKNRAFIKVLNGEAEKETYLIDSGAGRINIGREARVQATGNYVRKNVIAFMPTERNRSVSRQHAHIEWEADSNSFLVFADEGGIPPNNKMKVRTPEGVLIKMQAIEVGHRLQEGDQVILGDMAVLEFTYSGED